MIHPHRREGAAEVEVGITAGLEAVAGEEEEDMAGMTTLLHPPSQKRPQSKAMAGRRAASVPA